MKTPEPKASTPAEAAAPEPPAKHKSTEDQTVEDRVVELDRRGKPLPPRQRVGGIITPQ